MALPHAFAQRRIDAAREITQADHAVPGLAPGTLDGSQQTSSRALTTASVLVIEDEAAIAQLLATLMAPLGVRMLRARSGTEALSILAAQRPALITLDLVLPELDGIALLQRIRQRRDLDDVPVLMISAQAEPAVQRRAYQAGVSDFIAKPFPVDLMDAKLRAWLKLASQAHRTSTLRDFAHEVKNPLTAIGAAAHALTRPDVELTQRIRLGKAIAGEAERLGRMVQHYLYLDAGTGLIGDSPCTQSPVAVLRDLLDVNVMADSRSRVHLDLGITDDLPALRVDPDHLRQMLLNLIDNALAATARAGEVRLQAQTDDTGVSLSVRDTGVGIAVADLPHIFEDGFTTRGDQRRGLGLGITQRLCARAGGRIQVDSTPGTGTTFALWLPRAD